MLQIIRKVLSNLAQIRPGFWSEADFQFAFAWELQRQKLLPNAKIRLERCIRLADDNSVLSDDKQSYKSYYVDIWVEYEGKIYPIELKYKTIDKPLFYATSSQIEPIFAKNQAANDLGRYLYLKDVERIETIKQHLKLKFGGGFAIMLTNDKKYFDPSKNLNLNILDRYFRIHQDARFVGPQTYGWNVNPNTTNHWTQTSNTYKNPIHLQGTYTCDWTQYAGNFKYLLLEIK